MESDADEPVTCYVCHGPLKRTFTCIQCNSNSFCSDECWFEWDFHRPGAKGVDNLPHEKVDAVVVNKLRRILEPERTSAEYELEHKSDEGTLWFGIEREASKKPNLRDHGRFAALMAGNRRQDRSNRYPSLVSFIGETGISNTL